MRSDSLNSLARLIGGKWRVLLVLLLLGGQVGAEETSNLSLNGFGTLGAVRTTSRDVEFVRDLSQPRGAVDRWDAKVDSILGLQANWRLNPELEAVVQAVSRYRYDKTYTPEISWAYLKYDPTPQLSLRAGRLGTEFFMMADSRQVGYSYLPVRPPGDFFWYLPFYSINGADASLTLPVGDNVVRGKVYYGISEGKIPYGQWQWKLDGSAMVGGYLDYQLGAWLVRASYANIRFNHNMPIVDLLTARSLPTPIIRQVDDYLAAANTRSHYYSLGAIYDSGPWQLQLMLNKITQGSEIFESSSAGYVLAGYRIGQVTPYVGFSWIRSEKRGPMNNPVLDPLLDVIKAESHANQNTTILGARWDFARNLALKAQWDGIRGEPASIFPFREEQDAWRGKMDVFSISMDFVF
ncbi:MAG: hypothetical protein H6R15_3652 [Proteobacteria bacterium]|nr:hypothetical protein [Pseudomonadota bacterium]